MNRSEFLVLVDELLEQEAGAFQGPEQLADNGWDSLGVVGFIALAEEHFGVAIPPQKFLEVKTVNDLVGLVQDKLSA